MSMMALPQWLEEINNRLSCDDSVLVNLNLNIRRLNPEMLLALGKSLEKNTVLRILNLTCSLVSPEHEISLSQFVKQILNSNLQEACCLQIVHLSYNKLMDVTSIGHSLESNTSLKELYLDHNLIGPESATALANGLEKNETLEVLQLNSNKVADGGAIAIADALKVNKSLRVLGLSHNHIGTIGAQALEECLHSYQNMTLYELNLWENNHIPLTILNHITLLVRADAAGRRYLRNQSILESLWPHFIENVTQETDLLFYFLTAKPDLIQCSDKQDAMRPKKKRKRTI